MIIRTDRIRGKDGLDPEDDPFEVLVNPFASDRQLLHALQRADEDVLRRAAAFACDLQLQRALGWSATPEGLLGVLSGVALGPRDPFEVTKVLARAANGDWELAEQVVLSLAGGRGGELSLAGDCANQS